jgi:hypothetical protein
MIDKRIQKIKIIHASHASSINKFINIKLKLSNFKANINVIRTCQEHNVTPVLTLSIHCSMTYSTQNVSLKLKLNHNISDKYKKIDQF